MRDKCDNELVGCRTNTSSLLSTRLCTLRVSTFYALCNYNEVNVVHFRKRNKGLKTPRKNIYIHIYSKFLLLTYILIFLIVIFKFYSSLLFIASTLYARFRFILHILLFYIIHMYICTRIYNRHPIRTKKRAY